MRTARLLLPVLSLAVAASAVGSAGPLRPASKRQEGLRQAVATLEALVAEARKPAELVRVRIYRSYSPDQLALKKDRGPSPVTAEELLKYVGDEAIEEPVRKEAAEAIVWVDALRNDPALDSGGRGAARPRARFTMKVLPLLTDKDVTTRALAKALCEGLWPNAKDRDINDCVPADRPTCRAAREAWVRYLNK